MDVLSASAYDNVIAWYQNLGGSPPAFIRRVISRGAAQARAVSVADIDGDGYLDVLTASFADDTVSWFENERTETDPNVTFFEHVITTDAYGASAVVAAHMNDDGDIDVVVASYLIDTVAWYENRVGTQVGEDGVEYPVRYFIEHLVTTTADGAVSVFAADADRDGDVDVMAAAKENDTFAWYESRPGEDPAWVEHVLDAGADAAKSVHAAVEDVNDDEVDDVVMLLAGAGGSRSIRRYAPDPGGGFVSLPDLVVPDGNASGVDAVHAAGVDSDSDGQIDLDLDGDGLADAVYATSETGPVSRNDRVGWFGSEIPAETRISGTARGARVLSLADVDGDTDEDVVAADGVTVTGWYENLLDADPPAWEFHAIPAQTEGIGSIFTADIGGDDLPDIVAAVEGSDRIVWLENVGSDTLFPEHVVSTETDGPRSVFVADLDGDDDPDVLSASFNDNRIAWHENTAGDGSAWVMHPIADDGDGAVSVYAADLDGENGLDVLAAWFEDDRIVWYENDGLRPPGFTPHILASNVIGEADYRADGVTSVSAADLDDDGDMDVLAEIFHDGQIVWFENDVDPDDSTQRIFTVQLVTGITVFPTGMSMADVNLDGNLDLLSTSAGNDWVVWHENDDTDPLAFTSHVVGSSGENPQAVVAADFDADDEIELFAAFDFKTAWYESVGELCHDFDVSGDLRIDGVELSWLARAFTRPVTDPVAEWWAPLDYNADGVVDGDDLAILGSDGVWGRTTDDPGGETTGDCQYTCR